MKTPEQTRRHEPRSDLTLSPDSWRAYRLPATQFFEHLQQLMPNHPDYAEDILSCAREFYYVAFDRHVLDKDFSILSTLAQENQTGQPVGGKFHHIKAAGYYLGIANAVREIKTQLTYEERTQETNIIERFLTYLTALNKKLAGELKKMDPERKLAVSEGVSLNVDALSDEPLNEQERATIEMFNATPEKGKNGKTPEHVTVAKVQRHEDARSFLQKNEKSVRALRQQRRQSAFMKKLKEAEKEGLRTQALAPPKVKTAPVDDDLSVFNLFDDDIETIVAATAALAKEGDIEMPPTSSSNNQFNLFNGASSATKASTPPTNAAPKLPEKK